MRLLIKEYVKSLKERDELDRILPDVLSEVGYSIISRPSIGHREYGVDIAAVGPDESGDEKALYLISVKSGNLGRRDWDTSGEQALRPSLIETLEIYIPKRIAKRYQHLKVYVVLCFGGDILTNVRENVDTFIDIHTRPGKVEFKEWNGDVVTDLILSGLLREKVFSDELQSEFRKSLAFIDEPEVCLTHFKRFVSKATEADISLKKDRIRLLRQIYLASWNVYVWCRKEENLDAAYACVEFAALCSWDLCRDCTDNNSAQTKSLLTVCDRQFALYRQVGHEFFARHIEPYADAKDGLASLVPSQSGLDVTLKLFEILGRGALHGIWLFLLLSYEKSRGESQEQEKALSDSLASVVKSLASIIENNRALIAPVKDDHGIEVMLVCVLLGLCNESDVLINWVEQITRQSMFSYHKGTNYPCVYRDYNDLAAHPRNVPEYREDSTEASILFPTLAVWLAMFGRDDTFSQLQKFQHESMSHSNWQLWVPGEDSEKLIYNNGDQQHGIAISRINLSLGADGLIEHVNKVIADCQEMDKLSAVKRGVWPIVLMACRHFRMPVPVHVWRLINMAKT